MFSLNSVTSDKTLIIFQKKTTQVGAKKVTVRIFTPPALPEPAWLAAKIHGNDGNPIWEMCLILLKLQNI